MPSVWLKLASQQQTEFKWMFPSALLFLRQQGMFGFFFEGNCFFAAVVGLWRNVILRKDSADRVIRN